MMKKGKYEVFWENTKNADLRFTIVNVDKDFENIDDFEQYITKDLFNFDKFHTGSKQKYAALLDVKEVIRILEYDDEHRINIAYNDGYEIREFVKNKCIMQLKNKTII